MHCILVHYISAVQLYITYLYMYITYVLLYKAMLSDKSQDSVWICNFWSTDMMPRCAGDPGRRAGARPYAVYLRQTPWRTGRAPGGMDMDTYSTCPAIFIFGVWTPCRILSLAKSAHENEDGYHHFRSWVAPTHCPWEFSSFHVILHLPVPLLSIVAAASWEG